MILDTSLSLMPPQVTARLTLSWGKYTRCMLYAFARALFGYEHTRTTWWQLQDTIHRGFPSAASCTGTGVTIWYNSTYTAMNPNDELSGHFRNIFHLFPTC